MLKRFRAHVDSCALLLAELEAGLRRSVGNGLVWSLKRNPKLVVETIVVYVAVGQKWVPKMACGPKD